MGVGGCAVVGECRDDVLREEVELSPGQPVRQLPRKAAEGRRRGLPAPSLLLVGHRPDRRPAALPSAALCRACSLPRGSRRASSRAGAHGLRFAGRTTAPDRRRVQQVMLGGSCFCHRIGGAGCHRSGGMGCHRTGGLPARAGPGAGSGIRSAAEDRAAPACGPVRGPRRGHGSARKALRLRLRLPVRYAHGHGHGHGMDDVPVRPLLVGSSAHPPLGQEFGHRFTGRCILHPALARDARDGSRFGEVLPQAEQGVDLEPGAGQTRPGIRADAHGQLVVGQWTDTPVHGSGGGISRRPDQVLGLRPGDQPVDTTA